MNQEERIQAEIDSAHKASLRELHSQRDEDYEHSSGFNKPVMVYSNPNFKPLPKTETRLIKQKQLKKGVVSPTYTQSPALFLNKDPGSSYQDPYFPSLENPETGANYGDFAPRMRPPMQSSLKSPLARMGLAGGVHGRAPEIETAATFLKRDHAVLMKNNATLPRDPRFSQQFSKFYEEELKADPDNVKMAELYDKKTKKVNFAQTDSQSQPLSIRKNPKNLYKIGTKQHTRLLSNSSRNRDAFNAYDRQTNSKFKERNIEQLDSKLKFESLMIAPKERITENLKGIA